MFVKDGDLVFEPLDDGRFPMSEEGATFTRQGDNIVIAIGEEQAVDSYCESFTCSYTMDRAHAERLRDWLTSVLT